MCRFVSACAVRMKAVQEANRRTKPTLPLFLVVEERREGRLTVLNSGECFTMDEFRDGEALIEGGRKGERALVAVNTNRRLLA